LTEVKPLKYWTDAALAERAAAASSAHRRSIIAVVKRCFRGRVRGLGL
jgi:hypothetical protein